MKENELCFSGWEEGTLKQVSLLSRYDMSHIVRNDSLWIDNDTRDSYTVDSVALEYLTVTLMVLDFFER